MWPRFEFTQLPDLATLTFGFHHCDRPVPVCLTAALLFVV